MSKEIDDIKKVLLDEINKRFEVILTEFNDLYNELLNKSNKQMMDSIKLTKETQENTLKSIKTVNDTLSKRLNNSIEKFDKASKVLELDDENINVNSLKQLYKMAYDTSIWVENVSDDVKSISKEYRDFEKKMTNEERKKGVFKSLKGDIDTVNNSLDSVIKENISMKKNIKILEDEQFKINKQEMILGSSKNNDYNFNKGDFSLKINDKNVIIENVKNNSIIIVDDEGIKINGDVFINGNKL
jgi:hypothetical protein